MMVAIAYSDKSRDYTVLDPTLLASQPTPSYPAASATAWPNPQATAGYPPNGYGTSANMPPQNVVASTSSWDPTIRAGQGTFVSVPSTFPGQTFTSSPAGPAPAYVSAPVAATSPLVSPPGLSSMPMASPPAQPSMPPSGAISPASHSPYYR